ncbi:MAG: TolC family protein [Phycisphaerae bacterium]|jgi:cobalt-zinc-cadmium efflux system outer membrane protein|nr:TolC family protein [Phycisphaerae bacterium]
MMLSKFIPSAALGVALAICGCQLPQWGGSLPARRPLGAEFDVYKPSDSQTDSLFDEVPPAGKGKVDMSEPTGELSLRRALSLALAKSPELASFAWSVRQTEAEQLQASLLPNPGLETEFENFGGSGGFRGTRSLETTVVLSQLIELGGKRTKRIELARADSKLAGWRYEAKRLSVLTDVTRRFIAALAIQKKLELADEDLKLAGSGLDAVTKELAAGKVTLAEKTKATVEVAMSKIRLARIKRALKIAKSQLAATWGSTAPGFTALIGDLGDIASIPPVGKLTPNLDHNPELASWAAEIQKRQAALDLARAQAVPDVTAGVGYRHIRDTGGNDHALVAGVSIPLPVFDRNQGEIRKARYSLRSAKAQRRAAEVRLHTRFEKAYQTLAAARSEAAALRDEVLPAARSSYEASANSFEHGKAGYIDVLDGQRTFVKVREQYLEALEAYHSAVAGVEEIIARELKSVDSTSGEKKQAKGNNNVNK